MKTFVVRFCRTPVRYNEKEAVLVEADDPVSAVMVMRDHLLRRGNDPDAFVPAVGDTLILVREARAGAQPRGTRPARFATDEEFAAWRVATHEEELRSLCAGACEEYHVPAGRVVRVL